VSFSAVHTLAASGTRVECMVTEHGAHQTYAPFKWLTADRFKVPIRTRTRVVDIRGKRRVEAVVLRDLDGGPDETVACDTVVFTGDWIPDHELARAAGVELDPGTMGPRVDQRLATNLPGLFAAGNLLHGAETSDVAALEGACVAHSVRDWLDGAGNRQGAPRVRVEVEEPLAWIAPSSVTPGAGLPPRDRFVLRVGRFVEDATLVVTQARPGGEAPRELHRRVLGRLVPNRSITLDAGWVGAVDAAGGAVTVGVLSPALG
jgi:hypothetical protein